MQFRATSAFVIFIGSYFPLAIILAVQDIPSTWWEQPFCKPYPFNIDTCIFLPFKNTAFALSFLGLAAISATVANFMLRKVSFPYQIEIKTAKLIPNEIINYTFPYVVSFMGISYSEPEKLLGFSVFLVWMYAITYRSGQIIMNPLLLIFGWKLYESSILINGVQRDVRVLKRGPLTTGFQKAQTIQDFYICRD